FQASEAQFKYTEKEGTAFDSMKVGQDAFFNKAIFKGPVCFQSMKVAGRAIFKRARFEGRVNVRFADFGALDLSNASLPKVDGLSQLHYKYISAGHGAHSHKKLLQSAKSLPYSGTWYSRLEDFFSREGYRAEADKAFIAGKRREREQWKRESKESVWKYLRSGRWFLLQGSRMLDLLVGYGRRPWQATIPCAVM